MAIPMDQRDGWIWFDGELKPWKDAKIHVLTHGLPKPCQGNYEPFGIVNRAMKTWVVLSAVRLLDHIRYFPSGEKTGRPSKPSVKVIRILRKPSARIR